MDLNPKVKSLLGEDFGWDKGLTYNSDYGKLKLNDNGLKANGTFNPTGTNYEAFLGSDPYLKLSGTIDPLKLYYDAIIKEGGAYGLNTSIPFGGGTLSFDTSKDANDNKQYWLRYGANW